MTILHDPVANELAEKQRQDDRIKKLEERIALLESATEEKVTITCPECRYTYRSVMLRVTIQ